MIDDLKKIRRHLIGMAIALVILIGLYIANLILT